MTRRVAPAGDTGVSWRAAEVTQRVTRQVTRVLAGDTGDTSDTGDPGGDTGDTGDSYTTVPLGEPPFCEDRPCGEGGDSGHRGEGTGGDTCRSLATSPR